MDERLMRQEILCNLKIPPDKTVMKQIEIMCHLIGCNIILVTFLPKAHNLNLMRRYQVSRLRDIIQNNWFYNLQKSQVHLNQGKINILL